MAKLTIPRKVVGNLLTADEINMILDKLDELEDMILEPSHAFNSNHFKEEGTVSVEGTPVPVININDTLFNTTQFEVIDGVVNLK